jgi:hypothetical protein
MFTQRGRRIPRYKPKVYGFSTIGQSSIAHLSQPYASTRIQFCQQDAQY